MKSLVQANESEPSPISSESEKVENQSQDPISDESSDPNPDDLSKDICEFMDPSQQQQRTARVDGTMNRKFRMHERCHDLSPFQKRMRQDTCTMRKGRTSMGIQSKSLHLYSNEPKSNSKNFAAIDKGPIKSPE